jgi:hypothetical protein
MSGANQLSSADIQPWLWFWLQICCIISEARKLAQLQISPGNVG